MLQNVEKSHHKCLLRMPKKQLLVNLNHGPGKFFVKYIKHYESEEKCRTEFETNK